jgi:hypothetical protein
MVGDPGRLGALDQIFQAAQVFAIGALGGAKIHRNAVLDHAVLLEDAVENVQRAAPIDHEIFGNDLKPIDHRLAGEDVVVMRRAQAYADAVIGKIIETVSGHSGSREATEGGFIAIKPSPRGNAEWLWVITSRHLGAVGGAAALALARVLALAAIVAALTSTLALAGILTLASVLFLHLGVALLVGVLSCERRFAAGHQVRRLNGACACEQAGNRRASDEHFL